jgi:hypothetical protein
MENADRAEQVFVGEGDAVSIGLNGGKSDDFPCG